MNSQCIGSVGYFIHSQRIGSVGYFMNSQCLTIVTHYHEFQTHCQRRPLPWIPRCISMRWPLPWIPDALPVSANTKNSRRTTSVGVYFADASTALANMVSESGKLDFCQRTSFCRRIGRRCSALVIVLISADTVKIASAMDLATLICWRTVDALKCVGKSFADAILIFPDAMTALAKLYFVVVVRFVVCNLSLWLCFYSLFNMKRNLILYLASH